DRRPREEQRMTPTIFIGIAAAVFVLWFLRAGFRTVPQAHVMIIERLGRYHRTLQSGLNLCIPFLDRPSPFLMRRQGQAALQHYMDMREMVLGRGNGHVITREHVG